jgi:hypothetical protein
MIACCTYNEVLPPIIFSPADRAAMSQSGINHKMLIKYIQDMLAQACGALDRYPLYFLYLVLDRASIHNEEKILEAFHDNGCQELVEVWKMPSKAAKRMSPLDNALFHHWKERIRHGEQITKTTSSQEWLTNGIIRLPHSFVHSIVIVDCCAGMICILIVLNLWCICIAAKHVCHINTILSHCYRPGKK